MKILYHNLAHLKLIFSVDYTWIFKNENKKCYCFLIRKTIHFFLKQLGKYKNNKEENGTHLLSYHPERSFGNISCKRASLWRWNWRVEKNSLKLNIQKNKNMGSGPITSWQINGETMETVTDFIFLGSEITADSDCSHEIKRCLLLERKAMTNLDSILKSRDITLPTKVCVVKAMVFPVVMYGCESWTIKKTECQRTDVFELWCWRRLLRVPWSARRSNKSILKEISPE